MSAPAPDKRPRVVVVTGPTAAGKTPLAIEICEQWDGEIVNADSMQVYRGMDIGTAKPTREQQTRIRHHVIDCVAPSVSYNAARYLADARGAAADIHARGKLVVLTGGTGLYIRVFLEGVVGGAPPDPDLRAELEREHAQAVAAADPGRLHRRLLDVDPDAAERIHPNDLRRIVRALEISRAGTPASLRRGAHGFADQPYRVLHLAIDPGRDELDRRIDQRCREMIDGGLLQEVRRLREQGYGPELASMQAIGYRHMAAVVAGHDTLEIALEAMQRDTRRFARRQRTWLRGVPGLIPLPPSARETLAELLKRFVSQEDQ